MSAEGKCWKCLDHGWVCDSCGEWEGECHCDEGADGQLSPCEECKAAQPERGEGES